MTHSDPVQSAGSPTTGAAAPSAPVEIVERPDAGTLARGAWEAPASAFYGGAGVVLVAALLYAARVTGLFRRRAPRPRS